MPYPMETPEETEVRRAKTKVVLDELTRAGGDDLASHWAWEMTPMPVGLPSDEQLAEGREMARRALEPK